MKNESARKARGPWIKIAVTGGILLGAATIVGSGAFAVWTSSATANAAVSAGAIKINLTDSNLNATGMAPGDTIQELLPISFTQATNSGNLVSAIKFSVAASHDTTGTNPSAVNTAGANDGTGSSLFLGSVAAPAAINADGSTFSEVTAGSNALTFSISTCPDAWTKVSPATTYSCDVTPTVTAVQGTALNTIQSTSPLVLTPALFGIAGANTFPSDNGDVNLHSMISVTLPISANNSFTSASVKLTFSASVVQRAAVTTAP